MWRKKFHVAASFPKLGDPLPRPFSSSPGPLAAARCLSISFRVYSCRVSSLLHVVPCHSVSPPARLVCVRFQVLAVRLQVDSNLLRIIAFLLLSIPILFFAFPMRGNSNRVISTSRPVSSFPILDRSSPHRFMSVALRVRSLPFPFVASPFWSMSSLFYSVSVVLHSFPYPVSSSQLLSDPLLIPSVHI